MNRTSPLLNQNLFRHFKNIALTISAEVKSREGVISEIFLEETFSNGVVPLLNACKTHKFLEKFILAETLTAYTDRNGTRRI